MRTPKRIKARRPAVVIDERKPIEVPRDIPPKLMVKDMDDVLAAEGVTRTVTFVDRSDPEAFHYVTKKRKIGVDELGKPIYGFRKIKKPGELRSYKELAYARSRENPSKGRKLTKEEFAAMAEMQRKKREAQRKTTGARKARPVTMLDIVGIQPKKNNRKNS